MTEQARWSDDRFGDRYRQDDYRTQAYGSGDPYGRNFGQERYRDRSYGDRGYGDGAYGADPYAGGQALGGRGYGEDRSFASGERGYDPYGEEAYRGRRFGAAPPDDRAYDTRRPPGALMHAGYRAPFAGSRGDAQGYTNEGYRSAMDAGRYRYAERDMGYGRGSAGFGPQGYGDTGERGWWDQTRDEVSSWFGDDRAAHHRRMDEARHAVHRGHGPKGYSRSDDRIREDVNDRLTDDHFLDASDIEVKIAHGEVTLTGYVHSRHDKRRAEDIADQIYGVKHVQNNLRIQEHEANPAHAASATTGSAAQAAIKSN